MRPTARGGALGGKAIIAHKMRAYKHFGYGVKPDRAPAQDRAKLNPANPGGVSSPGDARPNRR